MKKGISFARTTFVVFFAIAMVIALFATYILMSKGHLEIKSNIKNRIEMPSVNDISFNALLRLKNDYPTSTNEVRNLLTIYNNTGESNIGNFIDDRYVEIDGEIFPTQGSTDNLMLHMGDYSFGTLPAVGTYNDYKVSYRKIAMPNGEYEESRLKFFFKGFR